MTLPEGLIYAPRFLTEAEERDVLGLLATFELHPYVLHDTPPRRLVRSFGLALVAGAYDACPAAPIPAGMEWLRERCAGLMGREPGRWCGVVVGATPRTGELPRGQNDPMARDRRPDRTARTVSRWPPAVTMTRRTTQAKPANKNLKG